MITRYYYFRMFDRPWVPIHSWSDLIMIRAAIDDRVEGVQLLIIESQKVQLQELT